MTLQPYHDVFLADGSSLLYRSFFQSQNRDPAFNVNDRGEPIGGVRLFTERMISLRKWGCNGRTPTHAAICFDAPGKLRRHTLFPDYKANRSAKPDELKPQLPLMREAAMAVGFHSVEMNGVEADDLVATFATYACEAGTPSLIISPDKDFYQLVSERISCFDFASGIEGQPGYRPAKHVEPAEVVSKFGVCPDLVTSVQALTGDPTDNIPGVPGVGPKTAARLVQEFGGLEDVLGAARASGPMLARLGLGKVSSCTPKVRDLLNDHADTARMAHKLVTLDRDVEAPVWVEDLELEPFDPGPVIAFAERVGMTTLAEKLKRGG